MKLAFVVQRFGKDIIGGAENHCYQIAKKLHDSGDCTVHVYTTTAFSYQTWSHFYPTGEETIEGLKVLRHKVFQPRWPFLFKTYNRLVSPFLTYFSKKQKQEHKWLKFILQHLEHLWFILQGPWCPSLVKDLERNVHKYDRVIFFTYLYYPSLWGLPKLKEKSILVPLAHQESPFYFQKVEDLLDSAPLLYANTEVEKELLLQKNLGYKKKIRVVGCGIDDLYFGNTEDIPMIPIPALKKPYIAYLGRISKGKGVDKLLQHFMAFLHTHSDEHLSLVLAGENDGSIDISYHPQIKFIGYISHKDKISLMAHAECIINPSSQESLSLLALEAIALKKPLLVNAQCNVLRYYATHLESVFDYMDETEFSSYLTQILHNVSLRDFQEKLELSRKWIIDRYSWEKVLSYYKSLRNLAS